MSRTVTSRAQVGARRIPIMVPTPQQAADETRQLREGENVLSSYHSPVDFLAEALQNATDAIDARRLREPAAPARVEIIFDRAQRYFSVADTGTGIADEDLNVILTPNVTFKAGPAQRSGRGRSRGEKGVGLSFLALGSQRLVIQTCNGKARVDAVVENARRWVDSGGRVAPPELVVAEPQPPDKHLGSQKYTIVTVSGLDPERYDEDLFDLGIEALIWSLRTRTAVGNTAHLFGRSATNDVAVNLRYVPPDGRTAVKRKVPYRYASPEELIDGNLIVPATQLRGLSVEALRDRTRGKAVTYRRSFKTPSGHSIALYAFIMDGREMSKRRRRAAWWPEEWQGWWVATRDMPTGIRFEPRVVRPQGYERRVFGLLQDDDIKLDLGRKTIAGMTQAMLKRAVARAWTHQLGEIVPRIPRAEEDEDQMSGVQLAALDAYVRQSMALPDLLADVPYLKPPTGKAAVLALFHELLTDSSVLGDLFPLRTGVFSLTDTLLYVGRPNGKAPLHVLFGLDATQIVAELEGDERIAQSAGLAVVWDDASGRLAQRGIEIRPADRAASGATHEMVLGGIANVDRLPVIVLNSLVGPGSGV